jgi:putative pyruvate formate lyase activating enzyme
VNRLQGERGLCGTGRQAFIASFGAHFGEESPLVGRHGSGTIFFSSCSLRCCFCQNYEISHYPNDGVEAGPEEIAGVMLELQKRGCHNINFVTPTHVVPQILEGLVIAFASGLTIPLVYNCSGYESCETLTLLDGIVDIYMPDFKFWSTSSGRNYCDAENYPEIARAALKEMHRQVGDLDVDEAGLATAGLLVRHLLMPGSLDETEEILRFIAAEISPYTYLNIMDQYRPCEARGKHGELERTIRPDEYRQAFESARRAGLKRLDERNLTTLLNRLGVT